MRIHVYIERYPNPYKPYIDAQLVEFLRLGHELMIFAGGAYRGTIHQEVVNHRLEEKTRYYPETLKDLPKHFLPSLFSLISAPIKRLSRIYRSVEMRRSFKFNLMSIARMLVLPTQPPDLCLIHNLSTAASFSFLPAYYPKCRVVMYFHGGEGGGMPRVQDEPWVFSKMHVVFTNTQYSKNLAVRRGCDPGKAMILPVGFSLPGYPMSPGRRYLPNGRLRLISVGRMVKEKGFQIALEAVKQLVDFGFTNIHYSIVGSGQQHNELMKFVENHRLGKYVTFMGELEKRDVVTALTGSDVLILPSLASDTGEESQACVVQEAMLMGLTVLTSITGGVPESIPLQMKEFSVVPGDAQAIRAMLTAILGIDERELHGLGVAGRKFVLDNYDVIKVTKTLLAQAQSTNAAMPSDQAV